MNKHRRGVCRFCGCTEYHACPGGCSWINAAQTVCSSTDCVEAYAAEKKLHSRRDTKYRPVLKKAWSRTRGVRRKNLAAAIHARARANQRFFRRPV